MNTMNHSRKPKITQDEIMSRIFDVHGNKYNYEKFIFNGVDKKSTITCLIHGDFETTPYHHYSRKQGCPRCNIKRKLSREEVLLHFLNTHGDRYCYKKFIYKNYSEKIIVTCYAHGDFNVKPNNHKNGSGCPKCGLSRIGYSRSKFKDRAVAHKGKNCKLYVIKCYSDEEVFYKIGITTMTIKRRFDGFHMPYDFNVIHEIDIDDPELTWDLEHRIHGILSEFRYTPKKYFRGKTECFSLITNPVKKLLMDLKSTKQLQLIA